MRFFVTGEQRREETLNTLVLFFLVYMIFQWISIGLMYFHRMSLYPKSIMEYYLVNPEQFTEPRSYQSLLEVSHAHLFSMGMLAVTLTHLLLFAQVSERIKLRLSLWVFFSMVTDELSGWLIRFVDPLFVWVKLGAFLCLEISMAMLIALVTMSLWRQRRALKLSAQQKHFRKRDSHTPPRVAGRTPTSDQ